MAKVENMPMKIKDMSMVRTMLSRMVEMMGEEDSEEPKEPTENSPEDNAEDDQEDENNTAKSDTIFEAQTELLSKSTDEERIAYSIAYPAMPKGWSDTQKDYITPENIRQMAHNWMINSGKYDINHKEFNVSKTDAVVVESFIAPVDIDWPIGNNTFKRINAGSWVVATKFSEPLWDKIRKKELNAYSIRGKAKRTPIK